MWKFDNRGTSFQESSAISNLRETATEKDIPRVIAYLSCCSGASRADMAALDIVARIGSTKECEFLRQLFAFHTEKQSVTRFLEAIALVMGRLGCRECAPIILRFVQDFESDISIGSFAIAALGRLQATDALETLLSIACAEMHDKGNEAARAIRLIGSNSVLDALSKVLESQHPKRRNRAVTTLKIIGTTEAERLCRRSLLDKLLGRRKWLDENHNHSFHRSFLSDEDYAIADL